MKITSKFVDQLLLRNSQFSWNYLTDTKQNQSSFLKHTLEVLKQHLNVKEIEAADAKSDWDSDFSDDDETMYTFN
eukprot:CAMPEP_0170488952 /NCGR_PEP_ID=MMETSP0208-20121228/7383_1 /TAXON_ID=197538 /ORGANISM="Strombidium inclinatum, Strain S3" /LENGTH=74 /DNA_ID=CAMNT_0010763675 /DNA_START=1 /DNA_END=222 /DNA_ORIENTATION=+